LGGEIFGEEITESGENCVVIFHFSLSLIKAIKLRTAKWVWHIERWTLRMECKVVFSSLEGKSPSEKSVLKWEDNAKIDLKEMLHFLSCLFRAFWIIVYVY